ncbi:hypothetical protein HRG_001854 [Hirsutella rhossiliensis]|uniref:Uncharacterized protein n=1 Tax=Hirsutella rhossiliensis TaxID=111463 RepID=A0A9P8N413_9HYPO|nr:uncharacterized protein HRG_01854 [Hirsutella rhossiliensis]KAH0966445.1 hypothetical protein HRG_01854 [Hirsutella rhossiliensis]
MLTSMLELALALVVSTASAAPLLCQSTTKSPAKPSRLPPSLLTRRDGSDDVEAFSNTRVKPVDADLWDSQKLQDTLAQ